MLSTYFNVVRLLTDESPRLRSALRYTLYGKFGVFDAERFIDVIQAFENFITVAKSGGGEGLNGDMAELGILQIQRSNVPVFPFPFSSSQSEQPIQTIAALAFVLSEKGSFFREFLLDEVLGVEWNASQPEVQKAFHKYYYLGISLRMKPGHGSNSHLKRLRSVWKRKNWKLVLQMLTGLSFGWQFGFNVTLH